MRIGASLAAVAGSVNEQAMEAVYEALDRALDAFADGLKDITVALRLLKGDDEVRVRVLQVVQRVESEAPPA